MANINYSLVVASQLGALLGMNLIHIRRKNVDPDYSNKERKVNNVWQFQYISMVLTVLRLRKLNL